MKSQSLELTQDSVIGVFGESVNITWTLRKVDQTDIVISTRLFLGNFTENRLLYEGANMFMKQNLAKVIFGERIQASFKEPIYTLTLSNLSYNDTFTFTLVVIQRIQNSIGLRPVVLKSTAISEVRGMYFL